MFRCLQCSFHKGDGFFPGTGDEDDVGEQLGYGYSVNIPLKVLIYTFVTDDKVFKPADVVRSCDALRC